VNQWVHASGKRSERIHDVEWLDIPVHVASDKRCGLTNKKERIPHLALVID